jgi:hypothetical protein
MSAAAVADGGGAGGEASPAGEGAREEPGWQQRQQRWQRKKVAAAAAEEKRAEARQTKAPMSHSLWGAGESSSAAAWLARKERESASSLWAGRWRWRRWKSREARERRRERVGDAAASPGGAEKRSCRVESTTCARARRK